MSTQLNHRDSPLGERLPEKVKAAEMASQTGGHAEMETLPREQKQIGVYRKGQGHIEPFIAKQQGPHFSPYHAKPKPRFAWAATVGNFLYGLGFSAEFRLVQCWRVLRDAGLMIGHVGLWLFDLLLGWVVAFGKGVWRDLSEPFRHMHKQRHLLEKAWEQGKLSAGKKALTEVRVKASLRFLSILIAFLLPVAAAAAFVLTVCNVVTMQYALAVEIDGQVIGHVADQTVVDSAQSILRERIQLAENQEISDWQFNPVYTIARASSYTTTQQLVNEILRIGSKNPGDIMAATGLYIGGQLYAVTEDGDKLKKYLDDYLQQKTAEADPEANAVTYVNQLTCDPDSEEVFFTDSVLTWEEMLEKLNSNLSEAVYVTADGESSLAQIAAENDVSQSAILHRNPDFVEMGIEYVPEAGSSVKIKNAQPLLQVQEVFRRSSVVDIPYQTIEIENPENAYGTRLPIQAGVVGQQEVWDDISVIDGEEQPGVRVETIILQPAVDEIIEVGTNQATMVSSDDYMFPVPTSTWSSRGISSYHRGLDINAPTGEPIFACQAGTVVTAGWHYSYGYHVVIQHADGLTTLYGHCSQLNVEAGQQVVQGQLIGLVGSTGNSTGPHCHLEFQRGGALLNPLDYVTPPPGYRMNRG